MTGISSNGSKVLHFVIREADWSDLSKGCLKPETHGEQLVFLWKMCNVFGDWETLPNLRHIPLGFRLTRQELSRIRKKFYNASAHAAYFQDSLFPANL